MDQQRPDMQQQEAASAGSKPTQKPTTNTQATPSVAAKNTKKPSLKTRFKLFNRKAKYSLPGRGIRGLGRFAGKHPFGSVFALDLGFRGLSDFFSHDSPSAEKKTNSNNNNNNNNNTSEVYDFWNKYKKELSTGGGALAGGLSLAALASAFGGPRWLNILLGLIGMGVGGYLGYQITNGSNSNNTKEQQ
jgi:hypothetical protein